MRLSLSQNSLLIGLGGLEISLVKRLSVILERVYKTTGRHEEAQRLGEWTACQPLIDPAAALFDHPATMFPNPLGVERNQSQSVAGNTLLLLIILQKTL